MGMFMTFVFVIAVLAIIATAVTIPWHPQRRYVRKGLDRPQAVIDEQIQLEARDNYQTALEATTLLRDILNDDQDLPILHDRQRARAELILNDWDSRSGPTRG